MKPNYEEVCRRFLADQQDFSEKNISAAGIQKRYQNADLEECVGAIAQDIAQQGMQDCLKNAETQE